MSNLSSSEQQEPMVNGEVNKPLKMYQLDAQNPPKNVPSAKILKAQRSKKYRDDKKEDQQDLERKLNEANKRLSELEDVVATKNKRIKELEEEVKLWQSCMVSQELESVVEYTFNGGEQDGVSYELIF